MKNMAIKSVRFSKVQIFAMHVSVLFERLVILAKGIICLFLIFLIWWVENATRSEKWRYILIALAIIIVIFAVCN
jgi:hypothetical protein